MDLRFSQRVNLFGHNVRSAFGIAGRKSIRLKQIGDIYRLRSEGKDFFVPSATRWRMYRFGLAERLKHLARDYGFDQFGGAVDSNSTVIDIGANVGEFSLGAAQLGAKVIAIDADPIIFECLSRNLGAAENVTLINCALWFETAELTFYSEPRRADSSFFNPGTVENAKEIIVQAKPLDMVLADMNLTSVDYLKCDAEGAEPEVLRGAAKTLAITKVIAIDTGPEREGQRTDEDCEEILTAAGFVVQHQNIKGRAMTFGLRPTTD